MKRRLTKHMTDNHKLSLEEYFNRYVSQRPLDGTRVEGEEDVSDPKEVDPQTEGSPPNADENIPQNGGQQKENEIRQQSGLNSGGPLRGTKIQSDAYKKWKDQCMRTCTRCGFENVSLRTIIAHMRKHQLSLEDGLSAVKVTLVTHTCQICKTVVQHDTRNLQEHMKTHSMDLSKYYYSRISPSASPPPSDGGQSKSCPIPPTAADEEERGLLGDGFKRWKDQCEYSCHCGFQTKSLHGIKIHGKHAHKLEKSDWSTREVKHTCVLCKEEVLHEARSLTEHLKANHQTSLHDYYTRQVAMTSVNVTGLDSLKKEVSEPADPALYKVDEGGMKCKFCKEEFALAGKLKDHLERMHKIPEGWGWLG